MNVECCVTVFQQIAGSDMPVHIVRTFSAQFPTNLWCSYIKISLLVCKQIVWTQTSVITVFMKSGLEQRGFMIRWWWCCFWTSHETLDRQRSSSRVETLSEINLCLEGQRKWQTAEDLITQGSCLISTAAQGGSVFEPYVFVTSYDCLAMLIVSAR